MNEIYHKVFETSNFIVVHKYPGVSFHTESGRLGLFETVRQNNALPMLFPVHRLDKITSGLLVMAKTAEVNHELCHQFSEKSVEKFYLSISEKKPRKKQGAIIGDMKSARRGSWMLTQEKENPAITQFFSASKGAGQRLFVIKPSTGKTHQIRVALKSLSAPVFGDPLYAAAGAKNADRGYLHAYSLGFTVKGEFFRFTENPLHGADFVSSSFTQALVPFAEPWKLPWPAL